MPRKGMSCLCFHSRTLSSAAPSASALTFFSHSLVDQSLDSAAEIIVKWNPDSSPVARVTSMFFEDKSEAHKFVTLVYALQKSMDLLVSVDPRSRKLVRAQRLMEIAMKRLQKEFYQILSINRANLDPGIVSARSSRCSTASSAWTSTDDDEVRGAGDSISEVEEAPRIAMKDLKAIADCMISSGYAKECVIVYKINRKSIVDEGIYRLGVDKPSFSQIHKMAWGVLDFRITNWLGAIKTAMKTLFKGERILCDHVFAASESIRESIFADISKEGALLLFKFPELAAKGMKSPEKVFRLLDMYTAIADNWPEIETVFSFDSTSDIRFQALTSLAKLGESVRVMISDLELSIQKKPSKSLVAGSGVHALTITTMNYLSLLGDYSVVLPDIFADWTLPAKASLPDSYFDGLDCDDASQNSISFRLAWFVLVLLCKLDAAAEKYKDVSSSYIFLANNLQHVVSKVRLSNLKYVLGDEWIAKHEAKVKQFSKNYERLAWGGVISWVTENPTAKRSEAEAKKVIGNFNQAFEQAYRKQSLNVVPNSELRDKIKVSIAKKIIPAYRELYSFSLRSENKPENYVKYTPDDIGNYLSNLFLAPSSSTSRQRHSGST